MSGSGKGLLGVWLYRRGEHWAIKEGSPIHKPSDVRSLLNRWKVKHIFLRMYRTYNIRQKYMKFEILEYLRFTHSKSRCKELERQLDSHFYF